VPKAARSQSVSFPLHAHPHMRHVDAARSALTRLAPAKSPMYTYNPAHMTWHITTAAEHSTLSAKPFHAVGRQLSGAPRAVAGLHGSGGFSLQTCARPALQSMSVIVVSCALAHSLVREPCSEQGQAAGACGQARLDLGLRHACFFRCKVMRCAALGPATQPCISLCSACRTRSQTHGMHQHKPCCTAASAWTLAAPQG